MTRAAALTDLTELMELMDREEETVPIRKRPIPVTILLGTLQMMEARRRRRLLDGSSK